MQTLALTTDATGKVRHDAVVKQQHGAGTLVQSSHADMLSKKFSEEQLMKPSEEEVAARLCNRFCALILRRRWWPRLMKRGKRLKRCCKARPAAAKLRRRAWAAAMRRSSDIRRPTPTTT